MKISLRKGLLTLGALFSFLAVSAQTVSGTVSDASGPLPGATVLVKGTTNGTQTDFDGNYTLNNVSSNAVIQVSYIGYKTVEKALNGASTLDFLLSEDAQALDEVVIIGYGSTTVKDATGSVTAVTSEDFNGGIIASPEQLIQGKTAGVQITSTSGEPGAAVDFRIRGTNSVRSNNNPLFVVDGIPLGGGGVNQGAELGFGSAASRNPLNFLNPNDIESISILKDASATAIYGSRGANGVVIITTKGGRGAGGGTFEFSSNLSISSPANEYDLLNRNEFLTAVSQFGGNAALQDFGANTDWQDYVTRTAASTTNNLAYSQTYKGGSVRASFGYDQQLGIIENSALERISGRLNLRQRFLDDKLTLNVQATISRVNDEAAPLSGSAGFRGDLLGAAYSANPTWPAQPDFNPGGQINPANLLTYTQNLSNTNRALLNGSIDYKFTDELSAKLNLGFDRSDAENTQVLSPFTTNTERNTQGNGRGAYAQQDFESRLAELTVNYVKELGGGITVDALVGYSFQDFRNWGSFSQGFGFTTSDLGEMAGQLRQTFDQTSALIDGSYQNFGYGQRGDVLVNRIVPEVESTTIGNVANPVLNSFVTNAYDNTDELQSFFARLNLNINDKFLITGTFRADGSSRFGGDNQYGYFPSGAIAWNLHNEDFLGDAFSTLKLRVGAGITGNQEGLGYANFLVRQRWADFSIDDGGNVNPTGLVTQAFANPELQWEETTDYNIGIDFGFNNDRISGTLNFYRKETDNLLLNLQAAQPSPQPFFFENIDDGTVLNQGVEFNIDWSAVETEDFDFGVGFNIAYNENEFQDFPGQIQAGTIRGQGLTGAFAQILAGGYPLFSYYLREFEGFDANGQPIGDNQTFVGEDALPDFVGGLSLNARYKNWDAAAYLTGQFGFSIYNNTRNAFFTAGAINNARNVTPDVLTSGEAGNAAAPVSTRFLESGDFVRMQNLTVGYNWPISGEGFLKSLRLSATGQNLFLITDYSGLDPEVSVQPQQGDLLNGLPTAGIDYTAFPRPRTITIGLNATF